MKQFFISAVDSVRNVSWPRVLEWFILPTLGMAGLILVAWALSVRGQAEWVKGFTQRSMLLVGVLFLGVVLYALPISLAQDGLIVGLSVYFVWLMSDSFGISFRKASIDAPKNDLSDAS